MFNVGKKAAVLMFIADVLKNPDTFNAHLKMTGFKPGKESAEVSFVISGPILSFLTEVLGVERPLETINKN